MILGPVTSGRHRQISPGPLTLHYCKVASVQWRRTIVLLQLASQVHQVQLYALFFRPFEISRATEIIGKI